MSRPPQNLCLIDYSLSQCKTVFVWYQFLLREKLKERRRSKIAKFIALTRLFPLRPAWKMGSLAGGPLPAAA
jgi:hypothetical protein